MKENETLLTSPSAYIVSLGKTLGLALIKTMGRPVDNNKQKQEVITSWLEEEKCQKNKK